MGEQVSTGTSNSGECPFKANLPARIGNLATRLAHCKRRNVSNSIIESFVSELVQNDCTCTKHAKGGARQGAVPFKLMTSLMVNASDKVRFCKAWTR